MSNGINYLLPKPVPPTLFPVSVDGHSTPGVIPRSVSHTPAQAVEEACWLYLHSVAQTGPVLTSLLLPPSSHPQYFHSLLTVLLPLSPPAACSQYCTPERSFENIQQALSFRAIGGCFLPEYTTTQGHPVVDKALT